MYIMVIFFNIFFQTIQTANAINVQVRPAFENEQANQPRFNLADNLEIQSNQGRGRGQGRGRPDGRRGQGQQNSYIFTVILLDFDQRSIPCGAQWAELDSNGRVKAFAISQEAVAGTTFRKLIKFFAEVDK